MLESLFEARDYEVVILLCQILCEVLWAYRDEKSTCPHKELLLGREKNHPTLQNVFHSSITTYSSNGLITT